MREAKGTGDPAERGRGTTKMTDWEQGRVVGVRKKEGLLTPEHCCKAKISMQEGWRGESFMKNQV